MSDQSLWYLENIDLENVFCEKKIAASLDKMPQKNYSKGDYIYLPEQSSDKIFLIQSGKVKIGSINDSGKEVIQTYISKGELFGEKAMIGESTRKDFAVAVEDTKLCEISLNQMKNLMKEHNALTVFFMKMMGSKMLELENRLESLVFKDSRSRIIDFLLELVETKGQRIGYEWVVRNFITHQEIANLTATSRQSVTTLLNELRSQEILTFDRKRLLIRDLDRLKNETN